MITKLTTEQEAKLIEYRDLGISIGLSTSKEPINEAEIRELTDKHRVACGFNPATYFEVFKSPFAACKAIPLLTPASAQYGLHDSYWLTTYVGYYREVLGLKEATEKAVHLYDLCKKVGWMWMSSNTTIVTPKPSSISLEFRSNLGVSVLHNMQGQALSYPDGTGIYCLNGIVIPLAYTAIMEAHPESITLDQIRDIPNTDVRNELLKRSPHLMDSATIIDTGNIEGNSYQLMQADFGTGLRTFLTGTCPSSGKKFTEFVPPQIKTVLEANAWREYDIEIEDLEGNAKLVYNVPEVRT